MSSYGLATRIQPPAVSVAAQLLAPPRRNINDGLVSITHTLDVLEDLRLLPSFDHFVIKGRQMTRLDLSSSYSGAR
jgi:hypothetical protein